MCLRKRKLITRRDFLSQSLLRTGGMVVLPSLYTLLATRRAYGSSTSTSTSTSCTATPPSTKTPFLCIDLAGGANIAGSNVIVGLKGGQQNFLSAYDKLGLPSAMWPQNAGMMDTTLGLAFHSDSGMLRGIKSIASPTTMANVDGIVLCTVSNDDTGNNPTNPMYWVASSGLTGTLTSLIGTTTSTSGGNSTVPPGSINPVSQPVQVTSAAAARSLVTLGQLNVLFTPTLVDKIMGTIESMSAGHLATFSSMELSSQVQSLVNCSYTKSRAVAQDGPDQYDPTMDTVVQKVFPNLAKSSADAQVATIAKLVLDGAAGAGTIERGGYDYHDGTRATGETADFAAGVAIGQCLELAAQKGKDLMIYVFTDGGITSSATVDSTTGGRGKLGWQGDSGDKSASFILMYRAAGKPSLLSTGRQIGYFNNSGQGVDTSSGLIATNVTNQATAVLLNYMALDGSNGNLSDVIGSADPFTGVESNYLLFNKQG